MTSDEKFVSLDAEEYDGQARYLANMTTFWAQYVFKWSPSMYKAWVEELYKRVVLK